MNIWSRWKQLENSKDVDWEKYCFAQSFVYHMAEIQGEISRVIRDNGRLERIRNDMDYTGEPQIIQHIFERIKHDPKNVAMLSEVVRAEKEMVSFLSGNPDAPSKEEMLEYWGKYLQEYISEFDAENSHNK